MAKLFLKELKLQLDLINEHLGEIRDKGKTDAFGTTIRKKDLAQYQALMARRRDLRKRIIEFEA